MGPRKQEIENCDSGHHENSLQGHELDQYGIMDTYKSTLGHVLSIMIIILSEVSIMPECLFFNYLLIYSTSWALFIHSLTNQNTGQKCFMQLLFIKHWTHWEIFQYSYWFHPQNVKTSTCNILIGYDARRMCIVYIDICLITWFLFPLSIVQYRPPCI